MQARRQFLKLPLQANFYPMPSQALIQDSQHRLSLHSAQALGVASLESGQWPRLHRGLVMGNGGADPMGLMYGPQDVLTACLLLH